MKKLLPVIVIFIITTTLCHAQIFYGMTFTGGSSAGGYGAIISFNAATDKDSVVWNLTGPPSDAASPFGNLVYDSINGLFYGMTTEGGSNGTGNGDGTIISFNPLTNKDSVVWNFAGEPSDGAYPEGDLIYDASKGLFYGMTETGGTYERGTIISFNPVTNRDSVVWNFVGPPSDGDGPEGDLVYDASNGLFYGMTEGGGTNDVGEGAGGTIISFNPANNKDSVLWSFAAGTDGFNPFGNLVYDAGTGLFYGMTHDGGANDTANGGWGTIISFNPLTNKDSVVWSFAGAPSDGEYPDGSLIYDTSSGLLFGMTFDGGANAYGAIISLNPSNNTESLVWSLGSGNDGSRPQGNLTYDRSNKLLYGMTQWGGTNGTGSIISFNPNGNSENVLWNFGSGTDGSQPDGSLVLYPPSAGAGINQLTVESGQLTVYPNPNNGQFTLQLNNNQIGNTIEIYNVMGERVYQSVLNNSQNNINLTNQPDGMYFVTVTSGNTIATGKILIAK